MVQRRPRQHAGNGSPHQVPVICVRCKTVIKRINVEPGTKQELIRGICAKCRTIEVK